MFVVAAELDDLPDLGVRRTVGIRRHMVLHLIARFGRDLRRAGHLPLVAVQVFQEPVFHTPGGGAHLEGDLHLGAGQDGAAAVEEPVVVHPRTGDAGVARLDVQLVVAGCVGVLQVIRHILDVTDALDRVDARGILRESAAGVVQILADGPPQRIRDQGLVLAFILDGSGHQIARSPVDAHGITREDDLMQVHSIQAEPVDRIHHYDSGLTHLQGAVDHRTPEGDVRNAAAREGGDVFRHVRCLGIVHRPGRDDFELVHDEGRALVEGTFLAVQEDHVPHFHVAGALHIQVLAVLREDKAALGDDGHLRGRDLGHGLIVQGAYFLDRQFLDALVGVTLLLDGDASAAFHGTALEQDGTGTGKIDDAAGHVVGDRDGDFRRPAARHRGYLDPRIGGIGSPGPVRIDLDGLRRSVLGVESQDVLAGRHRPGFHLLFDVPAAGGRQNREEAGSELEYIVEFHIPDTFSG